MSYCLSAFIIASLCIFSNVVLADNEVEVLQNLQQAYPDWKPRGIVDIGANRGGWTSAMQSKVYANLSIPTFMIEASSQHEEELEKVKNEFSPHVDYKITVLSGKDNDAVEFYNIGGTGDSMFPENSQHYGNVKPIMRTTSKLDTLVRHMEHIDYVKLDVQGAELMVLEGATETLERATFVQMEVSVIEYNQGGACWYELDNFLRNHGFYFYDSADYFTIPEAFHTKGIGQFDVLYIKPTSSYMPQWLVDNKVSFCGASANKNNSSRSAGSNRNIRSGSISSIHYGQLQSIEDAASAALASSLNSIGFIITFLLGYLVASVRYNNFNNIITSKQQGKKQ